MQGETSGDCANTNRQRSTVWNFFSKNIDKKSAECRTCRKNFKTPSGTTKTLLNHLQKHPGKYKEFLDENNKKDLPAPAPRKDRTVQQNIQTMLSREKMVSSHPYAQTTTNKITNMLVKGLLPYSFVEEEGFVELVKHFAPNYKIPARTTFSRNYVSVLYQETRDRLKTEFLQDLPFVQALTLTSDGWTSRATDSYVSLTCHYLNDKYDYKTFTMEIIPMNESHSKANIKSRLEQCVVNWGISLEDMTIPIYCITDNAPNFRSAAKTLFGDKARPCFAHSLQLAVDDSKSECPGVKKLLQKAKNIVGHYRRSSQARERLHSLQERMQVPQLELIQYVETRWSSEYCMLQRLVEMKGPIAAELAQSEHNIEPLTNADWAQAKGVLEVLEPLAQATKEISGDSYPTSSMVIPILHCLRSHLNSRIQRQEEGMTFARSLLKTLKSRFPLHEEDEIFRLSMLTDPRFKGVVINNIVASANLSTALRNELYRDFEEMDSTADEPEPSTSNSGLWSFFDSLPNERKEMNISEEVEKYLSEPRVNRSTNPYHWWKQEGCSKFPNVAKVALKYLGIPATQVSSERLFSSAGNVVIARRECLLPEHVQQLTFLHSNLKKNK